MLSPMLMDILAGRHCCKCDHIQPEKGALHLGGWCITGGAMWGTWMHKHFWNEVAAGNLGLDSRKLFRREYIN